LTEGRYAVALYNRGPVNETITLDYAVLQPPVANPSEASFSVRDIWAAADRGSFKGTYVAEAQSHGVVFLILAPVE